jgi:hypothetical protein
VTQHVQAIDGRIREVRSLSEELRLEAATPDAARQMLGIKGKSKGKGNVNF